MSKISFLLSTRLLAEADERALDVDVGQRMDPIRTVRAEGYSFKENSICATTATRPAG
jgi:hypothetical protein